MTRAKPSPTSRGGSPSSDSRSKIRRASSVTRRLRRSSPSRPTADFPATVSAASRPGRRSSRPASDWDRGFSTGRPRCCAATTSPSYRRRLSRLGFDPGRVDGIFGDQTATALMDFQRNAGLLADGILGRRTLDELARFSIRAGATNLVTPLRERLAVARGRSDLQGRRFAVVEPGGFATGASAVCRALRDAGAAGGPPVLAPRPVAPGGRRERDRRGLPRRHPARARGPLVHAPPTTGVSATSPRQAGDSPSSCRPSFPPSLGLDDGGIVGMALPILRETRMPAVEIQLGAPEVVVPRDHRTRRGSSSAP